LTSFAGKKIGIGGSAELGKDVENMGQEVKSVPRIHKREPVRLSGTDKKGLQKKEWAGGDM